MNDKCKKSGRNNEATHRLFDPLTSHLDPIGSTELVKGVTVLGVNNVIVVVTFQLHPSVDVGSDVLVRTALTKAPKPIQHMNAKEVRQPTTAPLNKHIQVCFDYDNICLLLNVEVSYMMTMAYNYSSLDHKNSDSYNEHPITISHVVR